LHKGEDAEKNPSGGELKCQLEPVDKSVLTTTEPTLVDHDVIASRSDKCILIVEDNSELRRFLKQVLNKQYHISEAEDGGRGWSLVLIFILPNL
jgi:hypothetical protein